MDQPVHEPLAFVVRKSATCREEPIFEISHGCFATFEARKIILAHEHHFDYNDDFLSFILQGQETLFHKFSIFIEGLGSVAAEDLYDFCGQLERSFFEFDAFAWGVREEKSEVDVHDVALDIYEDVSVVSIFDL